MHSTYTLIRMYVHVLVHIHVALELILMEGIHFATFVHAIMLHEQMLHGLSFECNMYKSF